MDDRIHIFVSSSSTEILIKSNFSLEMYVSNILKGVVRLIRAKKSIFSIIFFKDTINIYLFV